MADLSNAFGADGAPTDGIVFHPRGYVTLKTIVDGNALQTEFVPHRVSYRRGSHNRADECEVEIEGAVIPWPIRLVAGSFICVYLGVVDDPEDPNAIKVDANLRFCGYIDDITDRRGTRRVVLKAQDLSRPLREHKPLIKKVINGVTVDPTPRYTDTLEQAIRRILSVVPGWDDPTQEPIADLLVNSALQSATLGALVSGRAKNGPVALKPNLSAWEAIELVCGLAARHVNMQLRQIVVREPSDVFQDADPDPEKRINFIVGVQNANAAPPDFHKKFVRNRKGVKVVAWDTEQRQTVEAVYPSDADMAQSFPRRRPSPKKVGASRTSHSRSQPAEVKSPDREVYELDPGAYTPQALADQAKKIWLERATQEADGQIQTPIWNDQILAIGNGTRFFIKLSLDLERKIQEIGDDHLAIQFLKTQYPGMDDDAANTLLQTLRKPLNDFWYCKNVTFTWPGDMLATIEFINLLEV